MPTLNLFIFQNLTSLHEWLDEKAATSPRDALVYMDGFLFCAEILGQSLTKLADLYGVPILQE